MPYLNDFASGLVPFDMTTSAEFASLLTSAQDLGIPHPFAADGHALAALSLHRVGDERTQNALLLHGRNQSAHSWDLVSLHLSDRCHIYALDQRGHGDSEWTRDLDYSIDARVQDALAFIDGEGISSPVLVGHSMGGRVVMGMELARPGLARAIVVIDVGPELSAKGVELINVFVVHNVEFDDLEVFLDHVDKYDRFRSREHTARTVKYNMLRRADGKYVSKVDHRRIPKPSTELSLQDVVGIACPVLVVRGAMSDVLLPEAAQRFAESLPQGSLVTVPGSGHNVHSANTVGFLHEVGEFLAGLAP